MSARAIFYAMMLGFMIVINATVRLYVAVMPMASTPTTTEELAMMQAHCSCPQFASSGWTTNGTAAAVVSPPPHSPEAR